MIRKPLILKENMVQATIAGFKTQTRRPDGLEFINACPDQWAKAVQLRDGSWSFWYPGDMPDPEAFANRMYPDGGGFVCPYGDTGDVLWVRETWRVHKSKDHVKPTDLTAPPIWYTASEPPLSGNYSWGKRRPSIFLPNELARLHLRVVRSWPERLLDIREVDAQREGHLFSGHNLDKAYDPVTMRAATEWFLDTWDEIYKDRGLGTDLNPWVWAIEYEVLVLDDLIQLGGD